MTASRLDRRENSISTSRSTGIRARRRPNGATARASRWTASRRQTACASCRRAAGVTVVGHGLQRSVALKSYNSIDVDHLDGDGVIKAPMHGKVLAILVEQGASVQKGERVAVVEAMKMEHALTAPIDGTVSEIVAAVGAQIAEGATILSIAAPASDRSGHGFGKIGVRMAIERERRDLLARELALCHGVDVGLAVQLADRKLAQLRALDHVGVRVEHGEIARLALGRRITRDLGRDRSEADFPPAIVVELVRLNVGRKLAHARRAVLRGRSLRLAVLAPASSCSACSCAAARCADRRRADSAIPRAAAACRSAAPRTRRRP